MAVMMREALRSADMFRKACCDMNLGGKVGLSKILKQSVEASKLIGAI